MKLNRKDKVLIKHDGEAVTATVVKVCTDTELSVLVQFDSDDSYAWVSILKVTPSILA